MVDLSRAVAAVLGRPLTCEACGAAGRAGDPACVTCGAPREEAAVSAMIGGAAPRDPSIVDLEEAQNFVLLEQAANGALDGTLAMPAYQVMVAHLLEIAETAIRILGSETLDHTFAQASITENVLREDMHAAFCRLAEGLQRMQRFTADGDDEHVREGYEQAREAFVEIDRIEADASEL